MALESVTITKVVADSLLSYSQMAHPNEGILLLRGKVRRGVAEVTAVMIPPAAVHGESFSSFNWSMLPIDLSFVGVAHSHPSGYAVPSQQDLLHVAGSIMIIVGFPYSDYESLKVYDSKGNELPLHIR